MPVAYHAENGEDLRHAAARPMVILGKGPADGAVCELWEDHGIWYAEIRIPGHAQRHA